jgi:hypothetical protein
MSKKMHGGVDLETMEWKQALVRSVRGGKIVQLKNLESFSALDADLEKSMLRVSWTENSHIAIWIVRVVCSKML